MAKVVLCADGQCGKEVASFLRDCGDEIVRLYLHDPKQRKNGEKIIAASGCNTDQIFEARFFDDPEHVEDLKGCRPDFLITVYWANLIPDAVIGCAQKGTVNFHPSLLPKNRGWFPHVFNILEGTPAGVSLHALVSEADAGPIWAQREVSLKETDTAFSIYQRLQTEIVSLFHDTWPKIKSGDITPREQDHEQATYHQRKDASDWDLLDMASTVKVEDLIRQLKARSFGDKGFSYYEDNGRKIYVNLRLSETPDFTQTGNDDE